MKIWIDGYEANVSQRVGSGQVGFHLLKQIEKIDHHNEYTILLASPPAADLPKERKGFRYKIIKPSRLKTWIGIPLALYSAKEKPDVFFSPTHYIPRFAPKNVKRVVMIFDLAFFYFQNLFTQRDFLQLKNWTGFSIEHADQIVTISQSAKRDIEKFYGTNSDKITVSYPGYDDVFRPVTDKKIIAKTLQKYNLPEDFVVFLGTIQPRKNIKRLIESFVSVDTVKLVVIGKTTGEGKQGWKYEEILRRPKELGIEDKVIFTGFVPTQDLPAIFTAAKAYLLPSLYEGFGIPAAEAMACGTPAIVSDVSSLPEVVGNAGMLVDPNSTPQIAQAIKTISTDTKLRETLSKKSLQQAKKFSWEKMAKEVIEVLEKTVKKNG